MFNPLWYVRNVAGLQDSAATVNVSRFFGNKGSGQSDQTRQDRLPIRKYAWNSAHHQKLGQLNQTKIINGSAGSHSNEIQKARKVICMFSIFIYSKMNSPKRKIRDQTLLNLNLLDNFWLYSFKESDQIDFQIVYTSSHMRSRDLRQVGRIIIAQDLVSTSEARFIRSIIGISLVEVQ